MNTIDLVNDVLSSFNGSYVNDLNSPNIPYSKRDKYNSNSIYSPNSENEKDGMKFGNLYKSSNSGELKNVNFEDSMSLGSHHTQTYKVKQFKFENQAAKELKNAQNVLKGYNINTHTSKLGIFLQALSEDSQENTVDEIYLSYIDNFVYDKKKFYRLLMNDQ